MNSNGTIAYASFENEMERAERKEKRKDIIIIILIITILLNNFAWLAFFSQYDFQYSSVTAQGEGLANYIGNNGDNNNYARDKSSENKEEKRQE